MSMYEQDAQLQQDELVRIERSWYALGMALMALHGDKEAKRIWEIIYPTITAIEKRQNGIVFDFEHIDQDLPPMARYGHGPNAGVGPDGWKSRLGVNAPPG